MEEVDLPVVSGETSIEAALEAARTGNWFLENPLAIWCKRANKTRSSMSCSILTMRSARSWRLVFISSELAIRVLRARYWSSSAATAAALRTPGLALIASAKSELTIDLEAVPQVDSAGLAHLEGEVGESGQGRFRRSMEISKSAARPMGQAGAAKQSKRRARATRQPSAQ